MRFKVVFLIDSIPHSILLRNNEEDDQIYSSLSLSAEKQNSVIRYIKTNENKKIEK